MSRLISGIFLLIGGLIAFFIVSAFVDMIVDTGLTTSWSAIEVTLFTVVIPATFVFGTLVAAFMGIKRYAGRRFPPEE